MKEQALHHLQVLSLNLGLHKLSETLTLPPEHCSYAVEHSSLCTPTRALSSVVLLLQTTWTLELITPLPWVSCLVCWHELLSTSSQVFRTAARLTYI